MMRTKLQNELTEIEAQVSASFDNVQVTDIEFRYSDGRVKVEFSAHNTDHYINAVLVSEEDPFAKTGDQLSLFDDTITASTNSTRIYTLRIDSGIIDDVDHVNDDDTVVINATSLAELGDKVALNANHYPWPMKGADEDAKVTYSTANVVKTLAGFVDVNIDNIDSVAIEDMLENYFVHVNHRLTLSQWKHSNVYQLLSLFNDINDATDGDGAEADFLNGFLLEVMALITKTN